MRRLVILGDSLGMATGVRSVRHPDAVEYEESYPYLLRAACPGWDVISCCRRSNRTDKQVRGQDLSDDILLFKPHVVVVHLGINDCAPRLFGKYAGFIVSNLPSALREPIIEVASSRRAFLTRRFPKVLVNPTAFAANVTTLLRTIRSTGAYPIVIGIADTNSENKARSYGYENNIRKYNAILKEGARAYDAAFIDIFSRGDAILLPDGIHLTGVGTRWLTDEIARLVHRIAP